jgi:glycyl-tRNA synthetase alpha subunit
MDKVDIEKIDKYINDLKQEASKIISKNILKLPDNISSPAIDRLIDCIVSVSILENQKLISVTLNEMSNEKM